MRKKETPNPSRVRGRGVEVSETLFYSLVFRIVKNKNKNIDNVLSWLYHAN